MPAGARGVLIMPGTAAAPSLPCHKDLNLVTDSVCVEYLRCPCLVIYPGVLVSLSSSSSASHHPPPQLSRARAVTSLGSPPIPTLSTPEQC